MESMQSFHREEYPASMGQRIIVVESWTPVFSAQEREAAKREMERGLYAVWERCAAKRRHGAPG